jgi:hypothetical protein
MRTRTLIVLIVVMAVVALASWAVLADGDSGMYDWLRSLHGSP